MAVYLVINIAYLRVIPADELMNLESPAAAVAEKLFGASGGLLIKIGIIISVIGAGNGFLLSGSRVAYQLAVQQHLPASRSLSRLNRCPRAHHGCMQCGGHADRSPNLSRHAQAA